VVGANDSESMLELLGHTEVLFQFILLNACGLFLAPFFVRDYVNDTDWTWMTTLYWAKQTLTTVGK